MWNSGPKSGPVVAQSNTDKAMIGNRSKADPHANRSERRLRVQPGHLVFVLAWLKAEDPLQAHC